MEFRICKQAIDRIDPEDGNIIGVLICGPEVSSFAVNEKVSRSFPQGLLVTGKFESTIILNRENSDPVKPPVGDIKILTLWINMNIGAGINFFRFKRESSQGIPQQI